MLAEIPSFLFFNIEHPEGLLATLLGLALLWLIFQFAPASVPLFSKAYYRDILVERATRIEKGHLESERQLQDIQHLRNDYASRLSNFEAEERERIAAAVRDAKSARQDIIAEAQESAKGLQRRAEEEMARERTRQRILLRQQIVAMTLDAAEQSVKSLNTDDVQRKLIGDFVQRVGQSKTNGQRAPVAAPAVTPAAVFAGSAGATQAQSQSQTQETV